MIKRVKTRIRRWFIDLRYGVRNVLQWTSIVWGDRDYDYVFIFRILRFKLWKMEKLQRECGVSTDAEKIANEIHKCVAVLDRLIKDEYHENAFTKYDKKWKDTETHFFTRMMNLFTRQEREIERNPEEEKDFKRATEHEETLIRNDIDYLFDQMKRNIRKWWD